MKVTLAAILDENRDGDNESQASSFQESTNDDTTFEKLYHGLFGVLYLMAKDTSVSVSASYIYTFINTLQLLYYSFSLEANFSWHRNVYATLTPVLRYINFGFVEDLESNTLFVVVMSTFLLLGGVFAIGIYVGYSFGLDGTVKQIWLLPILRTLARLLTTVFYLPVLTVLLTCLDCASPLSNYDGLNCASSARTVLVVAAALLLLLFVILNGITALVFIGRKPDEQDALAQPHGRVDFMANLIKTIISIVFVLLRLRPNAMYITEGATEGSVSNATETYNGFIINKESPNETVLIIVLITGYTAILFGYMYYLPFYKVRTNKMILSAYSLCWWSSICVVFTAILGEREDMMYDHGPILLFIGASPIVAFATATLVDARIATLNKKGAAPSSPFILELSLRSKFSSGLDAKTQWEELKDLYRDAVDKNPRNGFICLHVAMMFDVLGNNKLMSSQYTRRAAQIPDLPLDQRFLVFQHKVLVDQDQKGTNGALSYMAFDHHFKRAQSYMSDTLLKVTEFWFRLRKNNYTMEVLFNIGDRVQKSSEAAKYHLDQLLQVSGGSPRALRLYAAYCEDIMNDKALARRILNKANELEGLENDFMEACDDDGMGETIGGGGNHFAAEVIDQSNFALASSACIATLSGDDNTLGEIVSVTDGVLHMFGYQRSQMVGQNISMLCPPPFDVVHDLFLKRYIETEKNMVTKKRKVWGFHKDGYSLSLDLYVMPIVNSDGSLGFTGKFIQAKSDVEFFLISEGGKIFTASKRVFEKCKLTRTDVEDGNASIQMFVPGLDIEDLTQNPDFLYGIEYEVKGELYRIQCIPISLRSDDARATYNIDILMLRLLPPATTEDAESTASKVLDVEVSRPKSSETRPPATIQPSTSVTPPTLPGTVTEPEELNSTKENNDGDSELLNTDDQLKADLLNLLTDNNSQSNVTSNGELHTVERDSATNVVVVPAGSERQKASRVRSRMVDLQHQDSDTSLIRSKRHKKGKSVAVLVPSQSKPATKVSPGLQQSASQHSFASDTQSELTNWTSRHSVRSHTTKRLHRIHQQITDKIHYQDARLQTFRKFCVVVVLIFAGTSFAEYYSYSVNIGSFLAAVELTFHSLRRSYLVARIATDIHVMSNIRNETFRDDGNYLDHTFEEVLHELTESSKAFVSEFRELHDMIANSKAASSEFIQPMFEDVSIEIINEHGNAELVSLNVAMLNFGNYARQYLNSFVEYGQPESCQGGCRYIVNNGPFAIREKAFEALNAHQQYALNFIEIQKQIDTVVFVILLVLVLLTLVKGLLPIVLEIQHSRNIAARAFASIPTTTTTSLFRNCKSKLYHLQTGEEQPQNNANEQKEGEENKEEDLAMKAKINQIESVQSKKGNFGVNGEIKTSKSFFSRLVDTIPLLVFVFKLVAPFIIVLIYFSTTTLVRETLLPNPGYLSAGMFYSGIRWVTVEELRHFVMNKFWDESNTFGKTWVVDLGEILATTEELDHLIFKLDKALLFGSDELGIPPLIDHSFPLQQKLNFENGCEFSVSYATNAKCRNTGDGNEIIRLLNVGLYGALQFYGETVKQYTDAAYEWNVTTKGDVLRGELETQLDELRLVITGDLNVVNDLSASLEHATDLFLVEASNQIDSQLASLGWLLLVSILFMVFMYYLVYRVFLGKNLQIKNTLVLLLMVPAEVFKQVPAMQRMVESSD